MNPPLSSPESFTPDEEGNLPPLPNTMYSLFNKIFQPTFVWSPGTNRFLTTPPLHSHYLHEFSPLFLSHSTMRVIELLLNLRLKPCLTSDLQMKSNVSLNQNAASIEHDKKNLPLNLLSSNLIIPPPVSKLKFLVKLIEFRRNHFSYQLLKWSLEF